MLMLQQGLRSDENLQQLRRLSQFCQQTDGYPAKIYWDALEARVGNLDPLTFVLFDRGEMVAWISGFLFTADQAEVTGLVHPRFRHQGIFQNLFQQLVTALTALHIKSCLLICHVQANNTLNKLVQSGARFHHSEIDMFATQIVSSAKFSPVELFPSGIEEIELLLKIHKQCFPTPIDQVRHRFLNTLAEPSREVFIAKIAGKPMGKIHVKDERSHILIHDFCIIPEYQHQGYGRSLLLSWYEDWGKNSTDKLFKVEVLGDNKPALALYQGCGFAIKAEYIFLQRKLS